MKKLLTAFVVIAGFSLPFTCNAATAKRPAKVKTSKKIVKKSVKKTPEKAPVVSNDVSGLSSSQYSCELGNKFTVYRNPNDNNTINLNWHNKMYRLARQATSTGAERFEDKYNGLVWLNIPAKSMLLDMHHGKQLANECRNSQQRHAMLNNK